MSGKSLAHNEIFANALGELVINLKGKPCRPYGSDFRVNIPKNTLYTYPDISVFCTDPETLDTENDTATNPTVIIEILSASTRNYDQGEKFNLYREIESLKEYILIDSQAVKVIKHSKNDDGSWLLVEYKSIEDCFFIQSIAVELSLVNLYENVKFV
jgi:Uma2 family endonuclease